MGLFAIVSAAKFINEVAQNDEVKSAFMDVSTKGLNKLSKMLDADGDGDFDADDFDNLKEYAFMVASILGHAALADSEIQDEEEEAAWQILDSICFGNDGIFNEEVLQFVNEKKKHLKQQMSEKLTNPYGIKQIAKYADEHELDEEFFEYICIIASTDEVITDDEQAMMDEFALRLGLSKFDVKKIAKKYIKH